MIDLLVSSLTADGGIETALEAAIQLELQDLLDSENKAIFLQRSKSLQTQPDDPLEHENLMSDEAIRELQAKKVHTFPPETVKPEISGPATDVIKSPDEHKIPLLNLVKQLLKNASSVTMARLTGLLNPSPNSQNTQHLSNGIGGYSNNSSFSSLDRSSPSVLLLLKFQRLLFSRLVSITSEIRNGDFTNGKF